MKKTYRNGPVGALQDEYERAVSELKLLILKISDSDFIKIIDLETKDEDCRSIQTILNHVVRAGYIYANYIREKFEEPFTVHQLQYDISNSESACEALDKMLEYHLETLDNKWDMTYETVINNIIETRWGQHYDFDQLFEHAIVHILRHRRQIERIMQRMDIN